MLPVAFTCPLWWVARRASRLLTGLALTVGLSLGAGAPAHATAPSTVVPSTGVPSTGAPTGCSAAADGVAAPQVVEAAARCGRGVPTGPQVVRVQQPGGSVDALPDRAGALRDLPPGPGLSASSAPGWPSALVAATGRPVVVGEAVRRLLPGAVPPALGSRAPPAR